MYQENFNTFLFYSVCLIFKLNPEFIIGKLPTDNKQITTTTITRGVVSFETTPLYCMLQFTIGYVLIINNN